MKAREFILKMERETKLDITEMGRGYLGVLLISILMYTGVVSGMYAGECMQVDLSELENCEDVLYLVVGNSSNLDGMNMSLNAGTNIKFLFLLTTIKIPSIKARSLYSQSQGTYVKYCEKGIDKPFSS